MPDKLFFLLVQPGAAGRVAEAGLGRAARWLSGRSRLSEAVTKTRRTDVPALRAYFASPEFALDLYKGLPGSYRSWDGQLRQQIVLADSDATIAIAPLPQFMHERNVLDTLGPDASETACAGR